MPRSCFLFSEFIRSRSSLMETWLRDGAVCIQGVTSGIVHFSVCVPCEGIQNCVHGMAFTAPVFGHRALCFSVISHEIPFKWCLLSDLGCRLSLFTSGSATARGPTSSISTSAEHFPFSCMNFCAIPSQFPVYFLGIYTNFVDLAKFCQMFIWLDPHQL